MTAAASWAPCARPHTEFGKVRTVLLEAALAQVVLQVGS